MKYIAVFILMLALAGCGGGSSAGGSTNGGNGGNGGNGVNPTLQVLASNVILSSASATDISTKDVDTETQVLAENVVLNTDNNKLSSDDLQDALDNEMAVDLSTVFVGTWTIENKTKDPAYDGLSGQITVSSDGTFSMDSGVFAAAGISATCTPLSNPTYEILGNDSIIYIIFTDENATRDSVMSVISATSDQIALVGDGACGLAGITKASILTKVE